MLTCQVYSTINSLDRAVWDKIANDDYFMSFDYLLHLESSLSHEYSFRSIVVYEDDVPQAVSSAFFTNVDVGVLVDNKTFSRTLNALRKIYKKAFCFKALIVGSPPSIGNTTLLISEQCQNKNEVLSLLIHNIEGLAKKERANLIVYKEFDQSFLGDFEESFLGRGYIAGPSLPINVLNIEWDSFDSYLLSMKQHYRYPIKANIKKITKNKDISIVWHEDISEHYDQDAHELYCNVLNKSSNIFETLSQDYFKYSNRVPIINPALICMYLSDRLIGYIFVADYTPKVLGALFVGIDYEYRQEFDTYFNLLYESIRIAISRGKQKLSFGQTAYDFKKRIGCVTEPLYIVCKHRNVVINGLIKAFKRYLFSSVVIEASSIFKSD